MGFFDAASVRAALRNDFAEYLDLERAPVRLHHLRHDGLSDALRLLFGRHHRESFREDRRWPVLTPPR